MYEASHIKIDPVVLVNGNAKGWSWDCFARKDDIACGDAVTLPLIEQIKEAQVINKKFQKLKNKIEYIQMDPFSTRKAMGAQGWSQW